MRALSFANDKASAVPQCGTSSIFWGGAPNCAKAEPCKLKKWLRRESWSTIWGGGERERFSHARLLRHLRGRARLPAGRLRNSRFCRPSDSVAPLLRRTLDRSEAWFRVLIPNPVNYKKTIVQSAA